MNSSAEKRMKEIENVRSLLDEYLSYIQTYGNECAYTDSILYNAARHLDSISKEVNKTLYLTSEQQKRMYLLSEEYGNAKLSDDVDELLDEVIESGIDTAHENINYKLALQIADDYYISEDSPQFYIIQDGLDNNLTIPQARYLATKSYSISYMENMSKAFQHGIQKDSFISYIEAGFEDSQFTELIKGLIFGLNSKQMELLSSNIELNGSQMQQIRIGLENGLEKEEIEVYLNPQFSSLQMEEIRYGLENKIGIDKVKEYADPDIPVDMMEKMRLSIENELGI